MADENGEVKVFGFADGRIKQLVNGHSNPVKAVAFTPDGSMLVSGDAQGGIIVWRVND